MEFEHSTKLNTPQEDPYTLIDELNGFENVTADISHRRIIISFTNEIALTEEITQKMLEYGYVVSAVTPDEIEFQRLVFKHGT